jgi:hypothetical protein
VPSVLDSEVCTTGRGDPHLVTLRRGGRGEVDSSNP